MLRLKSILLATFLSLIVSQMQVLAPYDIADEFKDEKGNPIDIPTSLGDFGSIPYGHVMVHF